MNIFLTVLFSLMFHYNIVSQESVDSSSQLKNSNYHDSTTIISENEVMPEIIGGIHSIQSKIIYPKEAKENNIQGIVYVKCKITSKGFVEAIKIMKGIGYGCDEEAVRVVKGSKWRPGKINNIPVNTEVSIPLIFKLKNSIITI